MRVNTEYGMLSSLVFATIRDTTPFNIFMIVWILYFCVLFKVMGSMNSAAQGYTGVAPIFGYFFYNFNNAIANPAVPTFSIWKDM